MALGDAIGLQDKPNLFASNLNASLARQSQKEAAQEAARRKAQEKDDAEFNKITSGKDFVLDPKIWDKRYSGVASKEMEASLGKILKIRKDNPNDWHNLVNQELLGLHDRLAVHLTNNNAWKDYKQKVRSGKFLGDNNALLESEKKDYSKDVQLDPETGRMVSPEWENDNIDPVYGVTSDAKGNFGGTPIPQHDYDKDLNDQIAHASNWTDAGVTIKPSRDPNVLQINKNTKLHDAAKERLATQRASDPDFLSYWAATHKDEINAGQKNGTVPKTPKEYAAWLSDQAYNETRSYLDSQRKSVVEFRNKPKEDKPKEDKSVQVASINPSGREFNIGETFNNKNPNSPQKEAGLYFDDNNKSFYKNKDGKYINAVTKEEETPVGDIIFEPSVALKTVATKGSAEFSPVLIQTAPEFQVDLKTGKSQKVAGPIPYSINGVDKLPYVTDKSGQIFVVTKDLEEKIASNPSQFSKPKYDWFATGIESAGMRKGKKVVNPRAVPLTKEVFDQLKTKKVVINGLDEAELWGHGDKGKTDVKSEVKVTGQQKEKPSGFDYSKIN